jgi:hypothetical protein
MIGGGVAHPEGATRLGNFVAMGGDEGVIGAKDLAVTPTSPPSGAVQIRPGACAIINQYGNYEAYAARLLDYDVVPIAGTGGTARTDMIVARVEDPFEGGGWPVPDAGMENTVQYVRSAVISGVSGDPLPRTPGQAGYGYSAIPLALVTLPAGTTTVLAEHITDLRNITVLRQQGDMWSVEPVAPADGKDYLGAADFATYLPGAKVDLRVPWWASEVTVKYTLSGVGLGEDSDGVVKQAFGDLRARFGEKVTEAVRYNDQNEQGVTRTMHMCGGKIPLPVAEGYRGSVRTLRLEGRKVGGDARIWADDKTTVFVEWSFRQYPEGT